MQFKYLLENTFFVALNLERMRFFLDLLDTKLILFSFWVSLKLHEVVKLNLQIFHHHKSIRKSIRIFRVLYNKFTRFFTKIKLKFCYLFSEVENQKYNVKRKRLVK